MGERDKTSLSSTIVTALSSPISQTDPEIVADYYCNWINRRKLPFPGSYALFKPTVLNTKKTYVEYL